jgi:T-complex protein 1 subunit delta
MEGGGNRVVKFTGIPAALASSTTRKPTVTILLRGSNEFVLAEASRSLHDALCVVRSIVRERFLIAGGGAAETYASYRLREYAATLAGKDAYCVAAFADALEVIPYTLAENAGMKPIEVVTELRAKHAAGMKGAGINVKKGIVSDMYELDVVQPLLVSTSAIRLATETVAMIMKIDDLIVIG